MDIQIIYKRFLIVKSKTLFYAQLQSLPKGNRCCQARVDASTQSSIRYVCLYTPVENV